MTDWDFPDEPLKVERPRRERSIEKSAVRIAEKDGWMAIKVGYDKLPDHLFIKKGVHVWWEFKKKDEEPDAGQEDRMKELILAGAHVGWSDNVEDCVAFLKTFG